MSIPNDRRRDGGNRARAGALLLVIIMMCGVAAVKLGAQETTPTGQQEIQTATPIPRTLPPADAAKTKAGFPAKLKRMTITGAGAFPFALFYTNFIFDSLRFTGNGFQSEYAPWPFKNQFSATVDTSEKFLRLGVSIGASAVVGILDALIQRR
ncbi:MAG: hypothetical protein CVV53_06525 [Spirochaetae bacterium HGW-Spirochaetae-9]|nr:MAG: hypothetical protein CVV53_06525 [Spirochaetae bacterium HGW-Spirochaetae-9]